MPYNKQLANLDRSVVTVKSQTSASCIDLTIDRSVNTARPQFEIFLSNDLTLDY